MKIGIDIDGVLLDSERNLKFYADYWSYFKLNKDRHNSDSTTQELCFDWTKEEQQYFYENFFNPITKKSHPMVGAKEIVTQLKKDGHQLYIITLRGEYFEEEIVLAKEFLKTLDIEFDDAFWKVSNKRQKCEQLGIDIMIDDSERNVEKFVGSNVKVLYFREPKIKHILADNIIEVETWMDIYREIQKEQQKMKG